MNPRLGSIIKNLIYNKVQLNTLSTYHRCYELWNLIKESKKLSGEIIEIGTWRGGSGALIAYQSKKHCPNSKVYLCDTFKGVVKSGENDKNIMMENIRIHQKVMWKIY